MAAFTILLNGESREIPNKMTLDQLLDVFSLPRQRVAVERNSVVVRRIDWPETTINKDDKIEVVHFVGGG